MNKKSIITISLIVIGAFCLVLPTCSTCSSWTQSSRDSVAKVAISATVEARVKGQPQLGAKYGKAIDAINCLLSHPDLQSLLREETLEYKLATALNSYALAQGILLIVSESMSELKGTPEDDAKVRHVLIIIRDGIEMGLRQLNPVAPPQVISYQK